MKKMNFTKKGLALLLGSTILVGSLSGCSEKNNSTNETDNNIDRGMITNIQEGQKEIFAPGEHILELEDDSRSPRLTYHPGYEIAGVYRLSHGYTQVIYVNNVEVECTATQIYRTNQYDYITFGTPIELEKQESEENSPQYSKNK